MRGRSRLFLLGTTAVMAVAVMAAAATPGAGEPEAGAASDQAAQELRPVGPTTFSTKAADMWEGLKAKWALGGNTMWALGFLAVVAMLRALGQMLSLRRRRIVPRRLATRANKLWQKGHYSQIKTLAWRSKSSLGRVIHFMVEHHSNPYQNIRAGARDIVARELAAHTRRNYPLSAVGTISPLLGLLGTAFGLMGVLATIAAEGSVDDPSVLADDISKALITAATGLIIAVMSLGLHHYFKNRTNHYAGILTGEVSKLMNAWFLKKADDKEDQVRRFR